MPPDPLDTSASGGRLSLGELFLSNSLSLHTTGVSSFRVSKCQKNIRRPKRSDL